MRHAGLILGIPPQGMAIAHMQRFLAQHFPEVEILVVDDVKEYHDEMVYEFKAPPAFDEPVGVLKSDFDDTYRGKCKRLRREARGW